MSDGWKTVEAPKGEHTTWKPEVNEELIGSLVERAVLGPKKSAALIVEDEMGNTTLVWENVVLSDRMKDVKIGQMVKIKYLGKSRSKNGNEYHNFEVAVKE